MHTAVAEPYNPVERIRTISAYLIYFYLILFCFYFCFRTIRIIIYLYFRFAPATRFGGK